MEAVEAGVLSRNEAKTIPGISFEKEMIGGCRRFLAVLHEAGLQPPIFVLAALLGVQGYTMGVSAFNTPHEVAYIDREDLLLPDVIVEGYDADLGTMFRPVFDSVWQATGWPGSTSYNAEGKWVDRGPPLP